MEIGLRSDMPTYSGGLGVLAGDTVKSAADMGVPMIAIAPLWNEGYFEQKVVDGWQHESYNAYDPRKHMKELPQRVSLKIEGRDVKIRAWQYDVQGNQGHVIPVFFLDTNLPENAEDDRLITSRLYRDNHHYRIRQEGVLGMGGVRMVQALGYNPEVYHLNEGHGAFVGLEHLIQGKSIDGVRNSIVFTTHTPVQAGHDWFEYGNFDRAFGDSIPRHVRDALPYLAGQHGINMTDLALNTSRYANAVSARHGEVSREMFRPTIDSITNGVHSYTWTSQPFQKLFDKYLPEWRRDPNVLKNASKIPTQELLLAHRENKEALHREIKARTGVEFDPSLLTLGFARRAATYKQGDLLFSDVERLKRIGNGKMQIVMAGKAHPLDQGGKSVIKNIYDNSNALRSDLKIVFLENYNMELGALLTAGSDIWLNAPERGREASGTSGMKSAHNGVPQLSTDDGWWCEANGGGWTFGKPAHEAPDRANDADSLYMTLQEIVLPAFKNEQRFSNVMQEAIGNAGYFNTHRMVGEYVGKAYGKTLEELVKVA